MKKNVWNGIALLFAALTALALAGCPVEPEQPSESAELNSITISGVTVTAPEGTARDLWLVEDIYASSMALADAILPAEAFAGEVPVTVSAKGAGAEIWYIQVSGGVKPAPDDEGWTQTAKFTFKNKDYLYIQVTSADKRAQNYYRVRVNLVSADAGIKALLIGGKNIGLTEAMGAATLDEVDLAETTLLFGSACLDLSVEAVKKEGAAGVQYALLKAADTAAEPQWGNVEKVDLDEGDKLYVKVTPSDTTAAPRYYGVLIHTTLRVTSVSISGTAQTISANGASSPEAATAIPITRVKQTVTGALTAIGASGTTVEQALLPADSIPTAWADLPNPASPETALTYANGSVLYLRVSAEGFAPLYYKFNIILQSNDRTIVAGGIAIGGTAVTSVGNGGTGVNVTAANRGAATINSTQAAIGQTVIVTFTDPTAKVTGFGVVAANATANAQSYTTLDPASDRFSLTTAIANGQHLILRVMAENATLYYHRIVVTVN
ncbi:hypothetical protein FACS189473_1320 [Spirochaetia bacterium]|nr:hypothetical protein FACS189473_1320 [Spirochaetia bacterium]